MKMTKDDYNKLKRKMFEVIVRDPDILTRKIDCINDMEMARRWTIYWIANKDGSLRYDYLNDSNIDTALKRIIAEYKEYKKGTDKIEDENLYWSTLDYSTKIAIFSIMIMDAPEIRDSLIRAMSKLTEEEVNTIGYETAKMYHFKYDQKRIIGYIDTVVSYYAEV